MNIIIQGWQNSQMSECFQQSEVQSIYQFNLSGIIPKYLEHMK